MAKDTKSMSKIVESLLSAMQINKSTDEVPEITRDIRGIDKKTFDRILEGTGDNKSTDGSKRMNDDEISNLFGPIADTAGKRILSNKQLRGLAPEIRRAGSIMIPSILSPNDSTTTNFSIRMKPIQGVEEATIDSVLEYLHDYFTEEYKLSSYIPKWIYQAMYEEGAKAVMVMPSSMLASMKKDVSKVADLESLFGDTATTTTLGDLENLKIENDIVNEETPVGKAIKKINDRLSNKTVVKSISNPFDCISFSSDFRSLLVSEVSKDLTKASLDRIYGSMEGLDDEVRKSFISLDEQTVTNTNFSIIKEQNYEAVIPIVIGADVENPLGYIVLINNQGNSICKSHRNKSEAVDVNGQSSYIDRMYKAFTGESNHDSNVSEDNRAKVVERLFESYFSKLINDGLGTTEDNGFKYDTTFMGQTMDILFQRTLSGLKTKAIFVPSKLMMYLAYEYDDTGMGVAKIDDIKTALSFKVTTMIAKLLSLTSSSIPHKNVSVDIPDDAPQPVELLKSITKYVKRGKKSGISFDPSSVAQSIHDSSITVTPKRLPGNIDFSVDIDNVNRSFPKPDDSLSEIWEDMIVHQLGVPAASLDKTKQEEYATTAVMDNLFLSNDVVISQGVTCTSITKLIRNICRFDTTIRNNIKTLVEASYVDKVAVPVSEQPEVEEPEVANAGVNLDAGSAITDTAEAKVDEIIESLFYYLPPPNIVNDRSQYNAIRDKISMTKELLENIYPDDISSDREVQDHVKAVRAFILKGVVSRYVSDHNAFKDVQTAINNVSMTSFADSQLEIKNLGNISDLITEVFKKQDKEGSGGSSW